ncbi:methyltransferase domain-containing protein [Altericroceibacterium endophyticum]|uniref:Methyltransferase domain-containing protein n=1 Tax=Altericroceibacterium endophyticum TaxID=1808508 RepID=A0A6I4T0G3_9SPHN|nr:methyltransferase domain-containing protein [Altericroceibacterium endophyticum]MXO64437.1 methyltransferase domain-containing protein [Altericroceibacterium endophyticum]
MNEASPPRIFSSSRRIARRDRLAALQRRPDAAQFVLDDMTQDVLERLAFIRHEPGKALIMGDFTNELAKTLTAQAYDVKCADPSSALSANTVNEELPYPEGQYDLIVSLGLLDTVNDLPGALIHMRQALAPKGFAIASFVGAGSLPQLRSAILAAEPDRPAARMHPLVDIRAGAQLLQRAGWGDPVIDGHALSVRYGTMDRLVEDLREQGLGSCLSAYAPPLGKAALNRARAAFLQAADEDGRVTESFEIITLSGSKGRDLF